MSRPVLSLKPRSPKPQTSETWFNSDDLSRMSGEWIKVTGTLVYEPDRNRGDQVFRKTFKAKTLVLDLPHDDLDLYYQHFLEQKYGSWYKLQRPMFGLHVTVVRGDEKPRVRDAWKRHEGRKVTVEYNPTQLRKKWQFWSMPVRSTELESVRGELGLSAFHDFHVTVAREYAFQTVESRGGLEVLLEQAKKQPTRDVLALLSDAYPTLPEVKNLLLSSQPKELNV